MSELRVCDGPFRAFLDVGFAGPRSTWRAVNIDDGTTWEGCDLGAVPAHGFAEAPAGTELVLDSDGRALVLAPSAAGATLGELIDATAEQGARMDPSLCVHLVCALAGIVLGDGGRTRPLPITIDHVLVGFDGSVRSRAHLPWWGPLPTAARTPGDRRTFSPETTVLHMLGEVAAEVLTSRRWPPPALVFPTLPKGLRRKVRQQMRVLLEDTTISVRELEDDDAYGGRFDRPLHLAVVRDGLLALARATAPASTTEVGVLVQHVFAERWANEERARAISDAAMTSD